MSERKNRLTAQKTTHLLEINKQQEILLDVVLVKHIFALFQTYFEMFAIWGILQFVLSIYFELQMPEEIRNRKNIS